MHNIGFLLALLIPLTIDTFVLSAALGIAGISKKEGIRTSLILAVFEALMPAVGVLIGRSISGVVGHYAPHIASAVIAIAGIIVLIPAKEEAKELRRVKLLSQTKGMAIIALGISISLDELAIGLSLGLLEIALGIAMVLLGIQAFVASQLGLWLGGRMNNKLRNQAEKFGGIALIIIAVILVILKSNH